MEESPSPRIKAAVRYLTDSLAAVFGPGMKRSQWSQAFRRDVEAFLGSRGEHSESRLEFSGVEFDSATRAFSRWCNLVADKPRERGVTATLCRSHPESHNEVRPVFRDVEIRRGENERCLADGVVLVELNGHRTIVIVEVDRDWRGRQLVLRFVLPRGDDVRSPIIEAFRKAMARYDTTRGRHLVFDAKGLAFLPAIDLRWDQVYLPQRLVDEFRQNTSLFLAARSNGCAASLPVSRSVLLYGPPGTGKTLLGKALLSDLAGTTFLWITPGGFDKEEGPAFFFHWARERAPAVLFFEDIDLVGGVRQKGDGVGSLGEILAQLDGFESNASLVVIATTNDPRALDEALRRPGRFDRQIHVDLPSEEVRRRMLDRFLGEIPVRDRARVVAEAARATRGFSGAHLREVADTIAIRRAVAGHGDAETTADDAREVIAMLRATRAELGFTAERWRDDAQHH